MLAVYNLLRLTRRATGQTKAQQTLVTIFGCDPIIREMSCKINHHGYVFNKLASSVDAIAISKSENITDSLTDLLTQ